MTIRNIILKYKDSLDIFDIELLIANSLNETREFVLSHPEYEIPKMKIVNCELKIARRAKGEPIAYITGHKEFYGLDFEVNKHTLVPRPETELLVELVLAESKVESRKPASSADGSKVTFVDIGTGSGNIITSIAHELENKCHPELVSGSKIKTPKTEIPDQVRNDKVKYYAIDLSIEALRIAKKNARKHGVAKKIKFLQGDLLIPFIGNWKLEIGNSRMIILANLPYLSKEIYQSAPIDVKKFEPKSALYSPEKGLQHYRKLLQQLAFIQNTLYKIHYTCILEISPEQKIPLTKLIKSIFPKAKISFTKDLAGKWRICKITIFAQN